MASTTDDWSTQIAEVQNHDILIRGNLLTTIIGQRSFVELAYLIIGGRWPTKGQAHVLEAVMVSVMEHGISPTTTVTRMMASYGNPIQVGVAAGLLTVGDHHGGAGEQIAGWLREAITGIQSTGSGRVEEIRAAARSFVAKRRAPHHRVCCTDR